MLAYAAAYGASAVVFGLLDALWLSVIARNLYQTELGPLLLEKPNMAAALAFYVLYLIGVQVFAVLPAVAAGEWTRALLLGAGLGLLAYATYDLTNLATLKGFSLKVVLFDLPWGAFVTASGATAGYFAYKAVAR